MARINWLDGAVLAAVLAALTLAAGNPAIGAERPIEWDDEAGTHNWTDDDNWNPAWVGGPRNDGFWEFLVTIPPGHNPVIFDPLVRPVDITDFIFGDSSKLVLNLDTDLSVLRTAEIAGIIDGQGGNFTAIGSPAITGCRARIYASSGSQVQLAAPSYCSTGLYATSYWGGTWNWTLLSAAGLSTELDLSALNSIDAGFTYASTQGGPSINHQHISVTDGARLNLAGVTTVTGPARSADSLRFTVAGAGSTLDLSSLSTIAPLPGTHGYTIFDVSDTVFSLPELTGVERGTFEIDGGDAQLPALETLVNTRFAATNGASITASGSNPATYSSTGLYATSYWGGTWNWTLLSAAGLSAELDLSALNSVDAGFTYASTQGGPSINHQHISVTDGARLSLAGVTTVTGPARSADSLRFTVAGAGSTLDLSSLSTIAPLPGTHGYTIFDVSDTVFSLPELTGVERGTFEIDGGDAQLPALETLVNTRFAATNGASITASGSNPATYSSTGLYATSYWGGTWNWTLLSAAGLSTELNLSALNSIDAGFTYASTQGGPSINHQHISATDGARLNLAGVTTVTGPARSADSLRFTVTGAGSTLDLSSLSILNSTGSGKVLVRIGGGGHVQTGAVTISGVTTTIDLDADSTLSMAGLRSEGGSVGVTLHSASDLLAVSGDLVLGNNIALAAPIGGTVRVGGHFLHEYGEPADSSVDLGNATVECVGDWQALEVGGAEYGLAIHAIPDHNFGIQQLIVGQPEHASVVELVDLHDNLDPNFPDALYLWGVEDTGRADGVDGLRILGGSTLVIGNLSVYALLDIDAAGQTDGVMEWVRINNLFDPGERRIAFDQGFIDRGPVLPDCNGNGVSDAVDIAGGFSQDCNSNGIPDECDIYACIGDPACNDCNANGVPDDCDIASGTSTDVDGDFVPDECIEFDDGGPDNNWSTAANWVADEVPDTASEAAAIAGYLVDLDIPVSIASLQLSGGATLNITGQVDEDLATEGGMRIAGRANGITETQLLIGNGRAVAVGSGGTGRMELTSGGAYRVAPGATPSASLTAPEVLITSNACGDFRGGSMDLSGTMSATITGDFIVRGNADCPGFPGGSAGSAAPARGGFTPPIKKTREQSTVTVEGNLRLIGPAGWVNESSGGVTLLGDFDNRGTSPSWFDWIKGRFVLDGTAGSGRTVEVAGLDLGDTLEGFATDQDGLSDTRPHRNYSVGTLEIAAGADVRFVNSVANTAGAGPAAEALYVRALSLGSGATVELDNCRVYYMWLTDDGADINKIGIGDLKPLTWGWDAIPDCLGGPDGGPLPMACEVLDFDNDGDVDLSDTARYQLLLSENG